MQDNTFCTDFPLSLNMLNSFIFVIVGHIHSSDSKDWVLSFHLHFPLWKICSCVSMWVVCIVHLMTLTSSSQIQESNPLHLSIQLIALKILKTERIKGTSLHDISIFYFRFAKERIPALWWAHMHRFLFVCLSVCLSVLTPGVLLASYLRKYRAFLVYVGRSVMLKINWPQP